MILLLLGCCTFGSSASLAFSCPNTTGGSSAHPINVTYYLTASACTTTNPGSGVLLSAHVDDNLDTVTFTPSTFHPSNSITSPAACNGGSSGVGGNQAFYSVQTSGTCHVVISRPDGAVMIFDANDVSDFAASLTSVSLSLPPSTMTLSSSPDPAAMGQSVAFTATVTTNNLGHTGTPTGTVTIDFGDGATTTATLAAGTVTINHAYALGGAFTATATYSGDSNFSAISASTGEQVVNATSTSLAASPTSASVFGQA